MWRVRDGKESGLHSQVSGGKISGRHFRKYADKPIYIAAVETYIPRFIYAQARVWEFAADAARRPRSGQGKKNPCSMK